VRACLVVDDVGHVADNAIDVSDVRKQKGFALHTCNNKEP
jgi:hypothetical protein